MRGLFLGQDGFSSVYAGTRRSDGLPVAIAYVSKGRGHSKLKVILFHLFLSALDIMDHLSLQEGHGRLPLEVALMTPVNSAPACPNVLQLLEWFDHCRLYTMVLERPVPCQDLQSFCEENGYLDKSLAKKVLLQLISALKHCESHGVLYRDIKPENPLISTESHDIKLQDIGCGNLLWFRQRRYHAGPGTVWSVGVMFYNILCGCFPFRVSWTVTSKS
ncbi:hypothetical protein M9458_056503 [Cirrhinus mrigala]|uniref:non-specific serine/threonine protein kinase n=1 Tax=Cirrhinus mrigala TaxID=683832 RepID=A0ABD0MD29_CIRMR